MPVLASELRPAIGAHDWAFSAASYAAGTPLPSPSNRPGEHGPAVAQLSNSSLPLIAPIAQATGSVRPPYRPPANVRGWNARLAWCLEQPARASSWRPLLYPCLTGGGKFGLCYGAYLIGLEGTGEGHPWLAGVVTMGASAALVVTGVLLLGNAVGQLSPGGAKWLKAGSLTGGALMGLGYGLGGHTVHHPDALWALGGAVAFKFVGAGMMGYTLPAFIGNAEAVLGDLPLGADRGSVAIGAFMFGMATVVGATSLQSPQVPPAAAQAVFNLGAFATMLAVGIAYRNIRPWPVQLAGATVLQPRMRQASADATALDGASTASAASTGTGATSTYPPW